MADSLSPLSFMAARNFTVKAVDDLSRTVTQAEYDALPESEKINGTTYYISDVDSTEEMVLSQAEYDALPTDQKMNGTTYYIYDGV